MRYHWTQITARSETPCGFLYINVYSAFHRSIVVEDVTGVKGETNERAPHRFSDVTFALWKNVCSGDYEDGSGDSEGASQPVNVSELRWVFIDDIRNAKSQAIIKKALGQYCGADSKATPLYFNASDEHFYVLLYTPNAAGISYMLSDYAAFMRSLIVRIALLRTVPYKGLDNFYMALEIALAPFEIAR